MNILKTLAEIFKKNIMFYIKIAPPDSLPENNKIEEIYFKGAWEEDGEARWVFFKTDDEHATARLNEEPYDIKNTVALNEETQREDTSVSFNKDISAITEDTYITAAPNEGCAGEGTSVNFNKEPSVIAEETTVNEGYHREDTYAAAISNKETYFIAEENPVSEGYHREDTCAAARLNKETSVIAEEKYTEPAPNEGYHRENTCDTVTSNKETSVITEGTYATAEKDIPLKASFKTIQFNRITSKSSPCGSPVSEEVVSITKLGYKMASRYSSAVITESSNVKNDLIDQRDIIRDEKIKVFFAEDNKSFQLVLRTLLNYSQDTELCGWAADGEEAIEKIKHLSHFPDVILMDIAMPHMDGISATKEVLKINPHASVIMLTAFGDKEHVVDAFESGASGFLRKDAPLPLVEEAIKQAARGGRPVHKEISEYVKEVKKIFTPDDSGEISFDRKVPSEEEQIQKKIEDIEKVIHNVERNRQILDEIIEKIDIKDRNSDKLYEGKIYYRTGEEKNKEKNSEGLHEDINRDGRDYLTPLNKDSLNSKPDNEIKQKILYYRALLREKPEEIDEIIKAFRELQEKHPENKELCVSTGIACFKKNLFKEGLEEFAKTLHNREFLNKKSIQEIINYDIIPAKSGNILFDVSDIIKQYEINDELWEKIKPLIPVRKKKSGHTSMEARKAMNAIFYVLQTGCSWKSIPRILGSGTTVHNRFREWKKAGVFKALWNNGIIDCHLKKVMSDNCKRRKICF
ncbi:MAG: transposase [Candidatus Eremiobacterota bacterium]